MIPRRLTFIEFQTELLNHGFSFVDPKVDAESIASLCGVSVDDHFYSEMQNNLVAVDRDSVWINPADANEYTALRRFLVAHGLAYFLVFGRGETSEVYTVGKGDNLFGQPSFVRPRRDTVVCNEFAAQLLMPTDLFLSIATKLRQHSSDGNVLVRQLAETFGVPTSLVYLRLRLFSRPF